MVVLQAKPKKLLKEPLISCRKFLFNLVTNRYFDYTILVFIILNTIVLAFKWYQQPVWVSNITGLINDIFAIVFIFEAVIKLLAFGT